MLLFFLSFVPFYNYIPLQIMCMSNTLLEETNEMNFLFFFRFSVDRDEDKERLPRVKLCFCAAQKDQAKSLPVLHDKK